MQDLKDNIEGMGYDILGLTKVVYSAVHSSSYCRSFCEVGCEIACLAGSMWPGCPPGAKLFPFPEFSLVKENL